MRQRSSTNGRRTDKSRDQIFKRIRHARGAHRGRPCAFRDKNARLARIEYRPAETPRQSASTRARRSERQAPRFEHAKAHGWRRALCPPSVLVSQKSSSCPPSFAYDLAVEHSVLSRAPRFMLLSWQSLARSEQDEGGAMQAKGGAKRREYRSFVQNVSTLPRLSHGREDMTSERISRPLDAAPRRSKDWR